MKNWKLLSKRGLALLLTLVMCFGLLQVTAFAEEELAEEKTILASEEEEKQDVIPSDGGDDDDENEVIVDEDEDVNDDNDESVVVPEDEEDDPFEPEVPEKVLTKGEIKDQLPATGIWSGDLYGYLYGEWEFDLSSFPRYDAEYAASVKGIADEKPGQSWVIDDQASGSNNGEWIYVYYDSDTQKFVVPWCGDPERPTKAVHVNDLNSGHEHVMLSTDSLYTTLNGSRQGTKFPSVNVLAKCKYCNVLGIAEITGATPDQTIEPMVKKVVVDNSTDKSATEGTFTFVMEGVSEAAKKMLPNGASVSVTTNSEETASFGTFYFPEDGDYMFQISEKNTEAEGYTYDTHTWTLDVTVEYKDNYVDDHGRAPLIIKNVSYTMDDGTIASEQCATFTNTYGDPVAPNPEPKTINVTAEKKWVEKDEQTTVQHDPVELQLLQNGKPYDGDTDSSKMTVDDIKGWTACWRGLPVNDENGLPYKYTVKEVTEVEGYKADCRGPVVDEETGDISFTITNTYETEEAEDPTTPDPTSVMVSKIWDDNDNAEGKRPDSITVQLLQNGEVYETVELNKGNGWTYTWTVPATEKSEDEGAEPAAYTYTVQEVDIPEGYTVSYSEDTFTITNTYPAAPGDDDDDEEVIIPGDDDDDDDDDDEVIIPGDDDDDDDDEPAPTTPVTPSTPDRPSTPNTPNTPDTPDDTTETNTPVVLNQLPDPREPDSPDVVTILEDEVPTTYVKVQDPETEEFMYIPEDDVPLYGFDVPQTGDSRTTILWASLSAVSLTGAAALIVTGKKRREDAE